MEQSLPTNIQRLLQDLRAKEPYIRKTAAEELRKSDTADERVLSALNAVIAADDNKYVKRAAADTFFALTGERSPEEIIEQESINVEVPHQQQTTTLVDKIRQHQRLIIAAVIILVGIWLLIIFSRPEINTSAGTLIITKARFTDRVPPDCTSSSQTCSMSEPGYRILIVSMKPKGRGNIETLSNGIPRGVSVVADNGSQTQWFHQQMNVSPPWVFLAFAVKDTDRNFKLTWPGIQNIALNPLLYFIP